MKISSLIRIIMTASVILFSTGVGVFSYLYLEAVDKKQEINLYGLVPQHVMAVLETDAVTALWGDMDKMQCRKDGYYLSASRLLDNLKTYLSVCKTKKTCDFGKQIKKVLISFHESDDSFNQVFYCALDVQGVNAVETLAHKCCLSPFPAKRLNYRGRLIHVYPLSDGNFLAAYYTEGYLVLSYQVRLIEQVIDAIDGKKTLMQSSSFWTQYQGRSVHSSATLYIKQSTSMSHWAEFDIELDNRDVLATGSFQGIDSVSVRNIAISQQKVIGDSCLTYQLPRTTFYHDYWALSDKNIFFDKVKRQEYSRYQYSDTVKQCDELYFNLIGQYAADKAMSYLFMSDDTLDSTPCAVVSLSLKKNVKLAENSLRSLLHSISKSTVFSASHYSLYRYNRTSLLYGYRCYLLPNTTLFSQLTDYPKITDESYVCFYRNSLLMAPDIRSLSTYIRAMEADDVCSGIWNFNPKAIHFSSSYQLVRMIDLDEFVHLSPVYHKLIPYFFVRNLNFFKHFLLLYQFTVVDDMTYPSFALIYKG